MEQEEREGNPARTRTSPVMSPRTRTGNPTLLYPHPAPSSPRVRTRTGYTLGKKCHGQDMVWAVCLLHFHVQDAGLS